MKIVKFTHSVVIDRLPHQFLSRNCRVEELEDATLGIKLQVSRAAQCGIPASQYPHNRSDGARQLCVPYRDPVTIGRAGRKVETEFEDTAGGG